MTALAISAFLALIGGILWTAWGEPRVVSTVRSMVGDSESRFGDKVDLLAQQLTWAMGRAAVSDTAALRTMSQNGATIGPLPRKP